MSSPSSPDTDLRAARRALTLFVVAVAAAAVGAIALLSGLIGEDSGDTTISPSERGEVDEIGPIAGDGVAEYVDGRRERLGEVEGRRVAVVSFASYLGEDDVQGVLGNGIELVSMLVAFPADEPRVVDDVDQARAEVAAEAESQLEEISTLVNTVEDPEFAEFYRAELVRYRKVLDRIEDEDVVFGAVVAGRAGELRALATRAPVRLVDIGDGTSLADDARVSGLRPEESITAGDPPFRP